MRIIGEVTEILSKKHVLLRLETSAEIGKDLTVFGRIPCPDLAVKYKLDKILIPKGRLRVISDQGGGLFIAEAYREVTAVRNVGFPHMGSLLSERLETKFVEGPPSADLSVPTTPVSLDVDRSVIVGDPVGNP